MKIALYTSGKIHNTRVTGGVRRFLELSKDLPKWCDFTLISGDEEYLMTNNAKFVSLHQNKNYHSEVTRALHNLKYLGQFREYDSVIVFDTPPALLLALANIKNICLMVRKDLIGYQLQHLNEEKANKIRKSIILKLLNLAEGIVLYRAKKVIVQCEYDKSRLINRHRVLSKQIENKIFVQINNINPSWIVEDFTKEERTNNSFSVGCITNFSSKRKGCDIFLEAISLLLDQGVKVEAYIAGDGVLLEGYMELFKRYPQIHFMKRISNANEILKKCDLAVVPSREDSCPNTVLEALMSETPVIGANRGGIPEILLDNQAMFNPDKEALAKKICEMMHSDNLIKIKERQLIRKRELTFDWSEKIYQLLQ